MELEDYFQNLSYSTAVKHDVYFLQSGSVVACCSPLRGYYPAGCSSPYTLQLNVVTLQIYIFYTFVSTYIDTTSIYLIRTFKRADSLQGICFLGADPPFSYVPINQL